MFIVDSFNHEEISVQLGISVGNIQIQLMVPANSYKKSYTVKITFAVNSKMRDKELDNLINDAANQHHPPYNDEDWVKCWCCWINICREKGQAQARYFLSLLYCCEVLHSGILQPWNNHKEDERSLAATEKNPLQPEQKGEKMILL